MKNENFYYGDYEQLTTKDEPTYAELVEYFRKNHVRSAVWIERYCMLDFGLNDALSRMIAWEATKEL